MGCYIPRSPLLYLVSVTAIKHLKPLAANDDSIESSHMLAMPSTLALCRIDASSETVPSRFRPPFRVGYVVRVLPAARCLTAVTRSVRVMEHPVTLRSSACDNHSSDIVSQAAKLLFKSCQPRHDFTSGAAENTERTQMRKIESLNY